MRRLTRGCDLNSMNFFTGILAQAATEESGVDKLFAWIGLVAPYLTVAILIYAILRARKQPLWKEAFRQLRRNGRAMVALGIMCLYGGVALSDAITWEDKDGNPKSLLVRAFSGVPKERTYSAPMANMTTGEARPQKLQAKHVLGTDGNGQDVLLLTLRGAKTAIIIGGLTTLIALPFALILGMLSGYYGKRVDDAIQYFYTTLASIPEILLLISLILVLGKSLLGMCIALGVTSWVGLCRLIRGECLKHRDREYVRAARALGASDTRVLFKHILPNLFPTVIISVTLGFSGLVLAEAILSYLQIGVPAEMGSWGNMIDAARIELARDPIIWWNLVSASGALFLLVLALNIFGDALRDAIDPRLRS